MDDNKYLPTYDPNNKISSNCKINGDRINIPTEEHLVEQLVRFSHVNIQAAATLSILYLSISRAEEVTAYHYTGIAKKFINIRKRAFYFSDMVTVVMNDVIWIRFPTRVQKKFKTKPNMTIEERQKQLMKTVYKITEIPYIESHTDFQLLKIIERYADQQQNHNIPVWNLSKSNLQKMAKRHLGIKLHDLRHWRCRHLVENYGYSASDLKRVVQWDSPYLPLHYSESRDSLLREKMLGDK